MKVYQAISDITGELAKLGISKDRKNQQQGYSFRGIDDVYAALSSLLAKYRLCIIPRVLSREVTERATQKGGVLFYTVLNMEFDFVAAEDGSKHTACTVGEAMDSADKSSNKAMSAAYKYACLQVFCIPTEGSNDADAVTHEVAASNGHHTPSIKEQTIKNALGAIKNAKGETQLSTIAKTIKARVAEGKIDADDAAYLMEEVQHRADELKAVAV